MMQERDNALLSDGHNTSWTIEIDVDLGQACDSNKHLYDKGSLCHVSWRTYYPSHPIYWW